jgi:hypothetical protein
VTDTASRPGLVPYIVVWSGEQRSERRVIQNRRGIAYTDELPHDRDSRGALWARRTLNTGRGKPRLGTVHPQRQRRVMRSRALTQDRGHRLSCGGGQRN